MNKLSKILIILAMLTIVSGCWDVKNIQYFNFVTAIGIDYKDNKYVVYAQITDLISLSKVENAGQAKKTTVVAKGEGESFDMAIFDLQKTSQVRTEWTQTKVYLVTEKALERGLFEFEDALTRTRDQRYSPWVFTTKGDLEDILKEKPIVGNSILATLIYQPDNLYKQQSTIEPLRFQKLVRSQREEDETSILIEIGIKNTWDKEGETIPLDYVKAAATMNQGKLNGTFTRNEILGIRWMDNHTKRALLPVHNDENQIVSSGIFETKKIKKKLINDRIDISVIVSGEIIEQEKKTTADELKKLFEKRITEEVMTTYTKAKEKNVDIYSLKHLYFRRGLNVPKEIPDLAFHVEARIKHANAHVLRKPSNK